MYSMGLELGRGAFGKVYQVTDQGQLFASKVLKKTIVSKKEFDHEVKVMKTLKHPNIVQLVRSYENDHVFFIVMEFCNGGNLKKHMANLDEALCRSIFTQLAKAMHYMHTQDIIHGDIKPENILIHNNSIDESAINIKSLVKIGDFGTAQRLPSTPKFQGTETYMAPEVFFRRPYGPNRIDLWSLGVILYKAIFKKHPCSNLLFYDRLVLVEWHCDMESGLTIPENPVASENCLNLLRRLLDSNPETRISFTQLIEHPFCSMEQL